MKKAIALIGAAALAGTTALTAFAGPDDDQLVVEGEVIATEVAAPEGSVFDTLYSGWRFRRNTTQALQTDDFENPAREYVVAGWASVNEGTEGPAIWEVCESYIKRVGTVRLDPNNTVMVTSA